MSKSLFWEYFGTKKDEIPYFEILQYSPAEISVIEMEPGQRQFDIVFINKLKANQFNIADEFTVIGKKCYH